MQLTYFGGVPLPTIDEDLEVPFETYSNIIALPYGSFDEHGQEAVLAPYTVTRTFKVACGPNADPLNTQLDALMRAFGSGRKVLQANWRDGSKRQTFAKVVNAVRPRRSDDKKYQELTVTFRIDYPYWFDTADEPKYLDHGYLMDTGLSMDGQYHFDTLDVISGNVFTITTHGTTPIRRGFIVLRPWVVSTVRNFRLVNVTNGMELRVNGDIVYNSTVVIDLLSRSCKMDAVNFYSAIEIPAGQMDWMQLEIGDNHFAMYADYLDGRMDIEYHWADTFL